ncbi:ABC transporter permease [Gordonia amarae]|uniref:ABC transporter permease protein n=2 Tax=Gordonia amarae TaxID=36821 RepID=G7GL53_9ACTN|nr:ABC-2 family transporter protein [Gordonia amarae]MCS3878854.1 ABC-2 type transport system permease protein [Gordonia amarae]QHN17415.1 ABC transporter permease [Gordonia amarae]QHN21941.1 ABC transporter permease [Gordonia amarae]QHN30821.1 ABC transporter permease [Gordonia amarae]QHN39567.1 ABC transporter permease [Gordonia amarae]
MTWQADVAAYRAVIGSRMRSQRSHRGNFRIDLTSSLLVGLIELAEVWVLFHNVPRIGGVGFTEMLLVFGLADCAYSVADMIFGHCDRLPDFIRAGTLDAFYLRPQPVLLQLITSDISLRRLARTVVGLVALTAGLCLADIDWSVAKAALVVLAVACGFAIFAAAFVWAAGMQFFLIDGAEATNAVVYGGRYAASQPASVWNKPLKVLFVFAFPMAFTAYLPAVQLLGLPGPSWLPSWLGWCGPVAAVWAWLLALLTWRVGVRHYQGGGG